MQHLCTMPSEPCGMLPLVYESWDNSEYTFEKHNSRGTMQEGRATITWFLTYETQIENLEKKKTTFFLLPFLFPFLHITFSSF